MNRERFIELVKQYSNETLFLSFMKGDHPAYVELMTAGKEALPWALEMLQDSIGQHSTDQDPWLLINLIVEMTDGKCLDGHDLTKLAGNLKELRNACLEWGVANKAC